MSTPPPSIPPDVAQAAPSNWNEFWGEFWGATFENFPTSLELSAEPLGGAIAQIVSFLAEVLIGITAELGKRYGEGIDEFEQNAGPTILNAAARGVSDYFGVSVSAGDLAGNRPFSEKHRFAEQLGRLVLENMFGAFDVPRPLTPDAGRDNAERLLGFNIATALESWLGQITAEAPLLRFIPNWADLDDLLSQNLGLGRANRRVLGPLLKTLIVDPFTWDLNRRFAPERFSPAELVELENRRRLEPGEFSEQMSWHGYSDRTAGMFRMLKSRLPGPGDLARLIELELITPERAQAALEAQGYIEETAALLVRVIQEDRVRTINTAMETVARDQYRDRVIDGAEYRSVLIAAGRAPGEIDSLLALGELERSRPRDLPLSTYEEGFIRGLIPLSALREKYEVLGFSLPDRVLLEEMAVGDRLEAERRDQGAQGRAAGAEFRTVPAGQVEAAYIEGRIAAARLREYYEGRGYSADDVALLMDNAGARKVERDRRLAAELAEAKTAKFTQLSQGAIVEAFIREVIDEGRLRAWYQAAGFSGPDTDIAVSTTKQKRAERRELLADELRRAKGEDFLELPRAVMEEAFFRDVVDETRLRTWYERRGFREAEIPILLQLARAHKTERASAAAASPTKPKA
ncbi:MAG: hypothetical protein ACREQ9_26985 [Candidatus Binatia bacterium]